MKQWRFWPKYATGSVLASEYLAERYGAPVDTMEVGDTYVDYDGDTWERIS